MTDSRSTRRRRAQEIAAMFAVAVIPRSFQRSLLPRSNVDQGIVTSLTVVLVYLLGQLTQDAIEATYTLATNKQDTSKLSGKSLAIFSAVLIGAGYAGDKFLNYAPDEKLPKSATRTVSKWVQYAGVAGLLISGVEAVNSAVSKDRKAAEERDLLPYFIGAGLLFTLVGEYVRAKNDDSFSLKASLVQSKPGRVIGITAGVAVLVGGLVYGERFVARHIDSLFDRSGKQIKPNWLPVGHLVGIGAIGAAVYAFMHKMYGSIEQSAENFETAFTKKPTSSLVSGGRKSLVSWDTLSVQGRRHTATALSAEQITSVMGKTAVDPIRIFVGIDSAETEDKRVTLALAELDRTGAYDRDYILVVSPTGTGYVNYIMSESLEYLALGNVASVTIQYSKRPSPMSLDRVGEWHVQYRMLLNSISKRLASMPEAKRPRLLLFGESLGAWTSQDAFIHSGTDGLRALNIDRALWIGTPMGSKWKEQVLSNGRLNTERELVGMFDSFEEVEALSDEARQALRYVMVTHRNDPIAQFGLELLVKQPEWLTNEDKRPKDMHGKAQYRSPLLFVQTLVDMKNALKPVPGEFVASAHDYRADLARFVAFSYGMKVTKLQMAAIEAALRENEIEREKLLHQAG